MSTEVSTHVAKGVSVWNVVLTVRTAGPCEFIDITNTVEQAAADSRVVAGTALVFSRHTTAAIVINEAEPGLLQDMQLMLARLAPEDPDYEHNAMARTIPNEPENAHAHLRHLLMGASETVPIVEGRLLLGMWQRIFLAELDGPRKRQVVVQVMGVQE